MIPTWDNLADLRCPFCAGALALTVRKPRSLGPTTVPPEINASYACKDRSCPRRKEGHPFVASRDKVNSILVDRQMRRDKAN